ncbi:MAG: hypothetical protein LBL67_01695 [Coriobacteriales bacterium]|nr:hypothetical protein [Coriobacteriales bacterium]
MSAKRPNFKSARSVRGAVKLVWSQKSGANGYRIYRKKGSKFYRVATIKQASTTTWLDSKVKIGRLYTYRMRAYRGKEKSAYSKLRKVTYDYKAAYAAKLAYLKNLSDGYEPIYQKYAFKDLDGNGVPELLACDSMKLQWVVYTLKSGKPKRLHLDDQESAGAPACYKGGYIKEHDHISTDETYTFYRIKGTSWKKVMHVTEYHYCVVGNTWDYHWTLNGKKTSKTKIRKAMGRYTKKPKLVLKWVKF